MVNFAVQFHINVVTLKGLKMSNVIKVDSSSPSLPVRQAKLFTAFQIEPFVKGLIFNGRNALSPTDNFKPSHVGMNLHTARAAMGGAVSVPGFVTALLWSTAAYAHGQKDVCQLVEGLPSASEFAIRHACGLLKKGAGINAGSAETVTLAALQAMLELPAPQKKLPSNGKSAAGTVTSKSTAKTDDDDDKSTAADSAPKPLSDADIAAGIAMLGGSLDNLVADKTFAVALAIEEEQRAKARWRAEQAALREADKLATISGKVQLFIELADQLSIKLTAGQLKMLDKAA